MGIEPMNTGFADQRVSHFATGARTFTVHLIPSVYTQNPPAFGRVGHQTSNMSIEIRLKRTPSAWKPDSNKYS